MGRRSPARVLVEHLMAAGFAVDEACKLVAVACELVAVAPDARERLRSVCRPKRASVGQLRRAAASVQFSQDFVKDP